jgi:transcriptional activator HAC1
VAGGVSTAAAAAGLVSALAAPAADGVNLSDAFSLSAALDADRYVIESGLLASPSSLDLEYDHLAGDDTAAFPFPPTADLFDINDYLNDELNILSSSTSEQQQQQHQLIDDCAAADSSLFNPETEVSSEDPIQQPHSGASSFGCDDGGIAVGVI